MAHDLAASIAQTQAGRDIQIQVVAEQNNYAGFQQSAIAEKSKSSTYYLPSFDPDSFVGRTENLAALRNALVPAAGRFLLSGEPGMGKSTVALKFASDAQKDFQAVLFQPCGRRSVEAIVGEMAGTLKHALGDGVSQLPPEEKLRAVNEWLKQQHTLLVLDDVWLESDTEFTSQLKLQDLLPDPSVSLLFTSRRPNFPFVLGGRKLLLDAFQENEVEEVFLRHLGNETLKHHRQALMDFAQRVERLPIAVIVGAQLLQSQFGPLSESARDLKLEKLRIDDIRDVPGLLRKAIAAQGEDERRILAAASACVPEGFWLPFAMQVAGLGEEAARAARDNLVNAALMRVVDQEAQRFQLHLLIREQARAMTTSLAEVQHAHASALEELFAERENRWRDCALCLSEIIPAVAFLRSQSVLNRADNLAFGGSATAWHIGELDAALQMEQQNEEYWKTVTDDRGKYYLQLSFGHQATVLSAWGELKEAMALSKKKEAICLELGNKAGLVSGYGIQALILQDWGKLEEAMALHKKEEAICLELGDKDDLQRCYGNQAVILKNWGKLDEAMALHKKKEAICLELSNKNDLQISYGNQAVILLTWGRLEEAMALLKEQEVVCLEIGNKHSLQASYANQALILQMEGKLEEAMVLHKKQEAICLEMGDKDSLQHSYGNQAVILRDWGKLKEAMALLKKQETVCLGLGNKHSLQISYANQALVLMVWRKLDEAIDLIKKQEAICLELGNKESLGHCYWYWGLLAREQQQPEFARQKLEQALAIFTELKMPRERDAVETRLKQESNT